MLNFLNGIEPWSWKPYPLLYEITCKKIKIKMKYYLNEIQILHEKINKYIYTPQIGSYQPNQ